MLHWIIQNSPYEEEGHYVLKGTLERMGIPHTEVKVIPFSHEITPDLEWENPVVVMGTIRLAELAIKRGWSPGAWTNEKFSYEHYMKHYGDHMLNSDAVICSFGTVTEEVPWNEFFFRPLEDGKEFAGRLISFAEQRMWAESIVEIEQQNYTTIDSDTKVIAAPIKNIEREYRYFIVDGKVITGSRYKLGDQVSYNTNVDDSWDFVQQMVDLWQPADAFVLDIALSNGVYKVLEINCLNSAGYYAIDVSKLVQAIMERFDN